MKTFMIIIITLAIGYAVYWGIFQRYSKNRLAYKALSLASICFLAILKTSADLSWWQLLIVFFAYVALAFTVTFVVAHFFRSHEIHDHKIDAELAPSGSSFASPKVEVMQQLGPALALRLIMADDNRYGLEELSAGLLSSSEETTEGWHSKYNAFLGYYGIDREPFIYFYYPKADDFLRNWSPLDSITKTFPSRRPLLLVEEVTALQRIEIENAGIKIRTFSEIIENHGSLLIYKKWLLRNLQSPAAINLGPRIIDCAVSLSGVIRHQETQDKKVDDITKYILEWTLDRNNTDQISVLGEYGQGKSVLSFNLAYHLLDNTSSYNRIPVLIELGGRSPRNLPPEDLIAAWGRQFSIHPHIVQYWIEEGKAVVIFDAFDEMDLVGDRNIVREHFDALWRFAAYTGAKIIITGRPNLFLDQPEREYALRPAGGNVSPTVTRSVPIHIDMLDRPKIQEILNKWSPASVDGLLAAYDQATDASGFRDLMSRPSMLMQIAAIWPQLSNTGINKDLSSARLMREFLYATFSRKRRTLASSPYPPALSQLRLSLSELMFFTRAIALLMLHKTGSANRISKQDYVVAVRALVENFPTRLGKAHLSEPLESDFKKLPDPRKENLLTKYVQVSSKSGAQILHGIEREVATTGILVEDEISGSSFRMAHKSFFEYTVAEHFVVQRFEKFFDSEKESSAILKALNLDYKKILLPFESVIHAANLVKFFGLEKLVMIKTNIMQRLIFKHNLSMSQVSNKIKKQVEPFFLTSIVAVGIFFTIWGISGETDYYMQRVLLPFSVIVGSYAGICFALSRLISYVLEQALSLVKWDGNTNRVIIAYNLLNSHSFQKLVSQMAFTTICEHLIGNCNVLFINGELVKVNAAATESQDEFWRISNDIRPGSVERLRPGTKVKLDGSLRRAFGQSELIVPEGGWNQVNYYFDDFIPLGTQVFFENWHRIVTFVRSIELPRRFRRSLKWRRRCK